MKRLILILAMCSTPVFAQTKPKQIRFPLIQVGVDAKTGTPMMGCATGQVLMRLEIDYVHVSGPIDKNGVIPITVEKTETWRISEDQTLLGDMHKRMHHECILAGHAPTEVSK